MERIVKVGVVGLGHIAHIAELPALSEMKNVEIVAAYDFSYEAVERAMAKYKIGKGCKTFEEFMEVEMDCAFVLTPKTTHYDYVIPLLDRGLDVFCEKPLALTLEKSKEMVDAAENKHKKNPFTGWNTPWGAWIKSHYGTGNGELNTNAMVRDWDKNGGSVETWTQNDDGTWTKTEGYNGNTNYGGTYGASSGGGYYSGGFDVFSVGGGGSNGIVYNQYGQVDYKNSFISFSTLGMFGGGGGDLVEPDDNLYANPIDKQNCAVMMQVDEKL